MTSPVNAPLSSSYDDVADTLYLSVGPKQRARMREDDFGIIWRVLDDGTVIGATVQAVTRWKSHPRDLVDALAARLPTTRTRIEGALPL